MASAHDAEAEGICLGDRNNGANPVNPFHGEERRCPALGRPGEVAGEMRRSVTTPSKGAAIRVAQFGGHPLQVRPGDVLPCSGNLDAAFGRVATNGGPHAQRLDHLQLRHGFVHGRPGRLQTEDGLLEDALFDSTVLEQRFHAVVFGLAKQELCLRSPTPASACWS